MSTIIYSKADLEKGLGPFLDKLASTGRIGKESGVSILRSGIEESEVSSDESKLWNVTNSISHSVTPQKDFEGKDIHGLFELTVTHKKKPNQIRKSLDTHYTEAQFWSRVRSSTKRKPFKFEYSINEENQEYIASIVINNIFDIRGECGLLKKYYDGSSKSRESAFGISEESVYAGNAGSCFAAHIEDMGLWSLNLCSEGAKFWYTVAPENTEKVIKLVKNITGVECNAIELSKCYFIDPAFLEERGIPVIRMIQLRGDLIVTFPYGLHWGFNIKDTLNISLNFAELRFWPRVALRLPLTHFQCKRVGKHAEPFAETDEILVAIGVDKEKIARFRLGFHGEFPIPFSTRDYPATETIKMGTSCGVQTAKVETREDSMQTVNVARSDTSVQTDGGERVENAMQTEIVETADAQTQAKPTSVESERKLWNDPQQQIQTDEGEAYRERNDSKHEFLEGTRLCFETAMTKKKLGGRVSGKQQYVYGCRFENCTFKTEDQKNFRRVSNDHLRKAHDKGMKCKRCGSLSESFENPCMNRCDAK